MAIRTKAGLISKKIEGNPTAENTDFPKKKIKTKFLALSRKVSK